MLWYSDQFRGVEWEVAALGIPAADGGLAPKKRRYPWGDTAPTDVHANLDGRALGCIDVAALPDGDSAFGCRQMLGNVWEWTRDWYSDVYYSYSENRNPTGPVAGSWRVIRGGSWIDDLNRCTTTMRLHLYPTLKLSFVGFRVVRSVELTPTPDQSDKPSVSVPPE